jgi:hypothetical protein
MGWYLFVALLTLTVGFVLGCHSTYSIVKNEIEKSKSIIIRGKLY